MVSLVADGSCIPPVIFTDDEECPKISFSDGYVLRVRSSTAASIDNMGRWLNQISPYLEDEPYLLMGPHQSRFNRGIREELEAMGVTLLTFPAKTGKVLDPVDNAFNALFKHYYWQQSRKTHKEMLQAIHTAYYIPTDENIRSYWRRIGYTSHTDLNTVVRSLVFRGWAQGSIQQDQQRQYIQTFHSWQRQSYRLYQKQILPKDPPHSLTPSQLDGHYWKLYRVA